MMNSPGIPHNDASIYATSAFSNRGLTATGYMNTSMRTKAKMYIEGHQDFRLASKGNTALGVQGVFTPTQKNTIEPKKNPMVRRTTSTELSPRQNSSQRQSAMSHRSSVVSRIEVKNDRVKVEANENQKKEELRFNDYLRAIENLKTGEQGQYQDEINQFRRLINRSINMCENVRKKGIKKKPHVQNMVTLPNDDLSQLQDQREILRSGGSSMRQSEKQ